MESTSTTIGTATRIRQAQRKAACFQLSVELSRIDADVDLQVVMSALSAYLKTFQGETAIKAPADQQKKFELMRNAASTRIKYIISTLVSTSDRVLSHQVRARKVELESALEQLSPEYITNAFTSSDSSTSRSPSVFPPPVKRQRHK